MFFLIFITKNIDAYGDFFFLILCTSLTLTGIFQVFLIKILSDFVTLAGGLPSAGCKYLTKYHLKY